jgi:thiamine-monophosphate kinase
MDEFSMIAEVFAPLAGEGSFGLKDDAAVIAARPGFDLVVTTDTIAEGTDFFAFDPADLVARKALRVNLSDLAAKGATPHGYLLSMALPPSITGEWLASFARGLAQDQAQFGITLLGGDTARTEGPLSISITALGFVPEKLMRRRNLARPGQDVYVTGTIGDSGGGLAIFKREPHALTEIQRDFLIGRYRLPEPPVNFGAELLGLGNASIDVSDGLVADLGHVAAASGIGIVIDAASIPLSDALRAFWGADAGAIVRAATTGDDYQIAFTADRDVEAPLLFRAKALGVTLTRIGAVVAGEGVELRLDGKVLAIPKAGYRHF